jgi:RNA polymerase sigma-70 factor (sigma-E family)
VPQHEQLRILGCRGPAGQDQPAAAADEDEVQNAHRLEWLSCPAVDASPQDVQTSGISHVGGRPWSRPQISWPASQRRRAPARPFNVKTDSADIIRSPGTPVDQGGPKATPSAAESARSVTELFTEHHLGLVRLALLMVGDLATAEDVVQDAFEQLHRRWRGLRQQSSALDYARSAVLNGCRSVLRRRLVARRYEGRVADPPSYDADAAIALEQRSELIDAFRSLPQRQREVLALRYYLDLSVADTAATLRISAGAVRSTASRGLATLARAFPKEP